MEVDFDYDAFIDDVNNNDPQNIRLNEIDLNNLPPKIIFAITICHSIDVIFNSNGIYEKNIDQYEEIINKTSLLLKKHNLESFKELLIRYQILYSSGKFIEIKPYVNSEHIEITQKKLQFQLDITDSLYNLMQYRLKNLSNIEIVIKGLYTNKINITDDSFLKELEKLLLAEFENQNLNDVILTYDEAKQEIDDYIDEDFIQEYLDYSYHDPVKGIIYNIDEIPIEFINDYAETHTKKGEITLYLVKSVMEYLKNSIKNKMVKKGAKSKNGKIRLLAFSLIKLYNFDKFINQSKIDSYSNFPISNECFRFVYDFLEIWGLLKNQTSIADKEHKANFIKSIVKQSLMRNKNAVLDHPSLIDKIRRVKFGESHFDNNDVVFVPNDIYKMEFLDYLTNKYFRS